MLTHDLRHKAAETAQLPSVDDWVANGGKIEHVEEAPRLDVVMPTYQRPVK